MGQPVDLQGLRVIPYDFPDRWLAIPSKTYMHAFYPEDKIVVSYAFAGLTEAMRHCHTVEQRGAKKFCYYEGSDIPTQPHSRVVDLSDLPSYVTDTKYHHYANDMLLGYRFRDR